VPVHELLAELDGIGHDRATGGYHRYSFGPADQAMRSWFEMQAQKRDMAVEVDRNGNLWATVGEVLNGGLIATGSHLDSVPDGGRFDGPLGIATAFAALDDLHAHGLHPTKTVAVVAFAEEEGARFGVACLGSRLLTGAIAAEVASALTDQDGVTLTEAMIAAGVDSTRLGPDLERLTRLECFVEVHIEQGIGLIETGDSTGLATGIWPHGRWRLDFRGQANHAGTTRMEDRDDPMAAFARVVTNLIKEAQALGARATFGRLQVRPNATNAVPSEVTAWLDARAADEATLHLLLSHIEEAVVTRESFTPAIEFDPELRKRMAETLGGLPELATAAGHDAGILASMGIPAAMLFVRNPSGVSHSPDEYASPEDCEAGAAALARVLADLAGYR
jgi:N-carbamoyl-L-amino-acid hydrolase